MTTTPPPQQHEHEHDHPHRLAVALRAGERVSALELFFDLVFVLAITQCTALMAHDPTWRGLARGLVLLGLLWWSWVGFAWLTSVVDPETTAVRLVLFGAMAALLVTSLCVPHAFDDLGPPLAVAYGAVRAAHIALFAIASHEDAGLRRAVIGLALSTAVGVGLLLAGSQVDGNGRLVIWAVALVLDMAGPLVIDTSGWRLVPGHFAERHGLIVIVALGESIVAIGVGAGDEVDAGVVIAAVLGMAVACSFWWTYFGGVSVTAAEHLATVEEVGPRNALARDAFSYLHLSLVAAIVLVALGMKTTLAHVDDPLSWVAATALAGGAALYVAGNAAFAYRSLHIVSGRRLVAAAALLAIVPLARQVDGVVTVATIAAVLWILAAVERGRSRPAEPAT